MPSLPGARGAVPPLVAACAPHFGLLRILFEASHNDKTTDNNMEKNNNVQTYFMFLLFSILCEIAGNQLLYENVMQLSVFLTRRYR